MIKKPLAVFFLLAFLAGCSSHPLKDTVSPQFVQLKPYAVAVMPVVFKVSADSPEEKDLGYLFRTMTYEKLKALNYMPIPLEQADEKYLKLGSGWFAGRPVHDTAQALNADSVLYIYITGWDKSAIATYASLKVKARFELYSATGQMLWQAEYASKESDIRLESNTLHLALFKVYEPRVQRFVDAVFSTLPGAAPALKKQDYFQWLP